MAFHPTERAVRAVACRNRAGTLAARKRASVPPAYRRHARLARSNGTLDPSLPVRHGRSCREVTP